jgi:predicted nuclease with TOPRIM domain
MAGKKDEPANLVLEILRRIDDRTNRMADDLANIKVRLTSVEEGLVQLNRRVDRLEGRLERVERRLELGEPVR